MPADQRGYPYKTRSGWSLRYRDEHKRQRAQGGFPSKTEALRWLRDVERPRQEAARDPSRPAAKPDTTLAELADMYLAAHAANVEPSTIRTLRERLVRPLAEFGHLNVRDLEHRSGEIAAWRTTLPEGWRYAVTQALRQTLQAGVNWGYLAVNPARQAGRNPQPKHREIQPFTIAEVDRFAIELGPYGPMVVFAAETGLRPGEWVALERRDVDRTAGVVVIERSFADGRLSGYGKTQRSRRRVPLTTRATNALDELPVRLNTRLLFPAPGGGGGVASGEGGYLHLGNWRRREMAPAVEAAGIGHGTPYTLRHTFATEALAAGLGLYELARYMGTSVAMIDRTYGHLARGSEEAARVRLDARAESFVH